ncbi:TPA: helix-turn-helix domain-containing protein [Acinetobacter nosocomialis]
MTASFNTAEMRALTNWLKQIRKSKHLTLRALAERMEKPHSFVQKVEQGERRLDVVEFVWYCGILGVNPKDGIDLIESVITKQEH